MSYYTINEEAARTANDLNSHYTYREGSATASYRRQVDEATELAERQKERVDPMYHEKIDRLLDLYCRKLAENLNDKYAIAARCPSMLVSGRANFPVQKKKKQNAAEERRLEEWKHIQGLLDKIRSVGTGGISSDDPQAVEKLEAKLATLEKHQEMMKAANAAIRMKDPAKGDAKLAELAKEMGIDTAKLKTKAQLIAAITDVPLEDAIAEDDGEAPPVLTPEAPAV